MYVYKFFELLVDVGLQSEFCDKLLSITIGLYSFYAANLPYTTP